MAQTLNLLVHGNPAGFEAWYNTQELKGTEAEFLRSLYSGNKSAEPTFLVKLRQEGASYVTYYHYLITQGVQEASGRDSGYIGLSLRIGGALSYDLQQIYALLDGLFRQQAVGTLVDKTNNGYRFKMEALSQLEKTFIEWESKIAKLFSFACATFSPQLAPAQATPGYSFAIADLSDQRLTASWEKYLLAGNSLYFAVETASQRTLASKKEVEAKLEAIQKELSTAKQEGQGLQTKLATEQAEHSKALGIIEGIRNYLEGKVTAPSLPGNPRKQGQKEPSNYAQVAQRAAYPHTSPSFNEEREKGLLPQGPLWIILALLVLIAGLLVYDLMSRPKPTAVMPLAPMEVTADTAFLKEHRDTTQTSSSAKHSSKPSSVLPNTAKKNKVTPETKPHKEEKDTKEAKGHKKV